MLSINRITKGQVMDLFKILPQETQAALKNIDIDELVNKYNQNLVFQPGKRNFS